MKRSGKSKTKAKAKAEAAVVEEKEKKWYIPPCYDIPQYKAENDPYCPAAKIRQFNDQQRLKLQEAIKNERNFKTWLKSDGDLSHKTELFEPQQLQSHISRKFYTSENMSSSEAEILHKAVVRERLLAELRKLLTSGSEIVSVMSEIVELIKAIRFETVDIIEDIAKWQQSQVVSRPFLFQGVNYLFKIASDLNYLDDYDEIVEKFCFEFKNNPLAYRGGGNLVSESVLRSVSSTSKEYKSEVFLQGILRSYYEGVHTAAVDGIEVVRLHNAEKIVQLEIDRISQQVDQPRVNPPVSQELQQVFPPTTEENQTPHAPRFSGLQPESDRKEKEKPTFHQKRTNAERIKKLKEEVEELQAMMSHLEEKTTTLTQQLQEHHNKKKLLEFRFNEAKSQGKEVASQHLAAEILVIGQYIHETASNVKENQKQSYFLNMEKKRKLLVIKKLKNEMLQEKERDKLKRLVEDKIKNDGLVAALDLVSSMSSTKKAKFDQSVAKIKKKSKPPNRTPAQTVLEESNNNIDSKLLLGLEEVEEEAEDDEGEDLENSQNISDEGVTPVKWSAGSGALAAKVLREEQHKDFTNNTDEH